jgi:hypothetical protein
MTVKGDTMSKHLREQRKREKQREKRERKLKRRLKHCIADLENLPEQRATFAPDVKELRA